MRAALALLALVACSPKNKGDTFVVGGAEIARWEETVDGKVRVPLVSGLAWDAATSPPGTLLRVTAREGPTVVLVTEVQGTPSPPALMSCATTHAQRVVLAASKASMVMTSPVIDEEQHRGMVVPHVHYAVGLEAKGDGVPASLMSSWTYVLADGRCVALGVTAVVRAKKGDEGAPDPEDLHRLHRVYSVLADGTRVL